MDNYYDQTSVEEICLHHLGISLTEPLHRALLLANLNSPELNRVTGGTPDHAERDEAVKISAMVQSHANVKETIEELKYLQESYEPPKTRIWSLEDSLHESRQSAHNLQYKGPSSATREQLLQLFQDGNAVQR